MSAWSAALATAAPAPRRSRLRRGCSAPARRASRSFERDGVIAAVVPALPAALDLQLGRLPRRRGARRRARRARRRLRGGRGRRLDGLGAGGRPRRGRAAGGGGPPPRRHADGDVRRARRASTSRGRRPRLGHRRGRRDVGRINDLAYGLRGRGTSAAHDPASPPSLRAAPLPGPGRRRARLRARRRSTTVDDSASTSSPRTRSTGAAASPAACSPPRSPRPASAGCETSSLQAHQVGQPVYARLGYGRLRAGDVGAPRVTCPERTSPARCLLTTPSSRRRSRRSPTRAACARPRRWSPRRRRSCSGSSPQALEEGGWFAEAHARRGPQGARRVGEDERLTRGAAPCSPRRRGWE